MSTATLSQTCETVPLDQKAAWSLDDVALATTLSKRSIQYLTRTAAFPHFYVGTRLLFNPQAVRTWIQSRANASSQSLAVH